MVTVAELWRGALPPGTELLAGAAGLERTVDWATSLRTRPPAFEAIKGGELAFVPVRSIKLLDERLDLAKVMASLADKGGVAVAILGVASADCLDLAEQRMVPLLQLPDGVHIAEIEQRAVRFILDQRTLVHERQQELHTELTELALAGAGTHAILERLAALSGLTAVWQSADGEVRQSAPPADAAMATLLAGQAPGILRWAESVAMPAADPPVRRFEIDATQARLVAPVPTRGGGIAGFVSLVGGDAELGQIARVAAARAAAACAIELDRERAVLQAREDLEGGLLESLLAGTYRSEESVRERAGRLGVDVDAPAVVLALAIDGAAPVERLLRGAQGWIDRYDDHALATIRRGRVAILAPAADRAPAELLRLAGRLRDACAGVMGGEVTIGMGRPRTGIASVRSSYREAEQALSMGARFAGTGGVINFADLGLHRLLLSMHGHPELEEYYTDQIGTLLAYDQRTKSQLMQTLEAFFACHGSPTDMAARLHLHRNTVLYRIRRIEEIGKLDLNDPGTRLNLHLCLRVRDVLSLRE